MTLADKEDKTPKDFQIQLGSYGLKQWSGYINEEFLVELKGRDKWKVYREMSDNDAMIGSILFAIEMLIRQCNWFVEPASEEADDVANAEFVEEAMNTMDDMSWEDLITEILSFLIYGFSYNEVVYKQREDGRYVWKRIINIAQESLQRWEFNDEQDLMGLHQDDPATAQSHFIPVEKAFLFRTKMNKNNPEGKSILRNAYRSWYFKKHIEEIEGIGIERDLAGLPVMKVPAQIMSSNASSAEQAIYAECKTIIRDIRRDEQEGVIFPSDIDPDTNQPQYSLELLSTGGTRQFNTNEIINRYDQRIAMTVLADFLMLGHEKVGSFALSSDKTSLFAVAIGSFLEQIKSVLNNKAVKQLFAINGVKLDKYPKIQCSDIEKPDLQQFSDFMVKMAQTGMPLFPDKNLEQHVRDMAGLPEAMEDDGDDFSPNVGNDPLEMDEFMRGMLEQVSNKDKINGEPG